MQQREISATGCINRVEKLFAYLRSDYGSVFVPPSSALPTDCTDVDMTKYYRTGDVVHFTAVPQTGKNNCSLLAVKINLSKKSCTYQGISDKDQPTQLTNQSAIITCVNDTFAFAKIDNLGQIFVPGGVYQSAIDEAPRLTTHLCVGDVLICDIRKQTEHNGCTWLALSAIKAPTVVDNETPQLFEYPSMEASVQGIEMATESSQAWCCTLRAIRWGPCDVPVIIRKSVCDSSAQTVLRSDDMLVHALQVYAPDMIQTLRNKLPNLVDYCIE